MFNVVDGDAHGAFVGEDDALLDVLRVETGYCQMTLMTGMLMLGKMSVGVRSSTNGVSSKSSSAATTNV